MTAPAVIDASPDAGLRALGWRRGPVALVERRLAQPRPPARDPPPAPDPAADRDGRAAAGDAGRARRLRQDHAAVRLGRARRAAVRVGHARRARQRPGAPARLGRARRGAGRAAARPGRFVLVLDDAQVLRAPAAHAALAGLLEAPARGGHARAGVAHPATAADRADARRGARRGARCARAGDGRRGGHGDGRARRPRARGSGRRAAPPTAPRAGRPRSRSRPWAARQTSGGRTGWSPTTCATRSSAVCRLRAAACAGDVGARHADRVALRLGAGARGLRRRAGRAVPAGRAADRARSLGRAVPPSPAGRGDVAERAAAARRLGGPPSCTAARATGTAPPATTTAPSATRSPPATSRPPATSSGAAPGRR